VAVGVVRIFPGTLHPKPTHRIKNIARPKRRRLTTALQLW
jgi:hypothetical protein